MTPIRFYIEEREHYKILRCALNDKEKILRCALNDREKIPRFALNDAESIAAVDMKMELSQG